MADHASAAPARVREQVIDVTGVEAANDLLSGMYGRMRVAGGGARRGMRLVSANLGPVRFDRMTFRMTLQADADPLRSYVFGIVRSGRMWYGSERVERGYLPGDVFFNSQPDHGYVGGLDEAELATAVFGQDVVDQVAQTGPGGRRQVRFTSYDVVSARAASAWRTIYDDLRDAIRTDPETMAHPLVAGNAARLLVAATLAAFPNTALTDPTIEDRHDAHPPTLRRAISFIEANADRDICVTDVAEAACVTARAVQLAFRRHLDTTPMAFLRRVRLDGARAELRAATPCQDTVTQVAARWGFHRAGVFAAHYRAAFGESPSKTLRDG
jgi:AraC-like DNA-binding protein